MAELRKLNESESQKATRIRTDMSTRLRKCDFAKVSSESQFLRLLVGVPEAMISSTAA
jgi:hypothetical protein